MSAPPVLEVRGLEMHFPLRRSGLSAVRGRATEAVRAVDGVDFTIARGESVGLVGESGCGKSTLGRCIVGLYKSTAGEVRLNGLPVVASKGQRNANPRVAQIIFQDPYSSLNPRMTVQQTLLEALHVHQTVPREDAERRCSELLDLVRLSSRVAEAYPRQLSGGQRQRVSIARALAVEPELLVADEPVSALDVSVQATVLNLLAELRKELGLTLLLIAHNMAVVRHVCDRTMVMYLGRIIETGPTERLIADPQHPYTRALLTAIPRLTPGHRSETPALLGDPPSPIRLPVGCRFNPRCSQAASICHETEPRLLFGAGADADRAAACHFAWTDPVTPTTVSEAPSNQ
ncbi:MAG TPA: ABC transporter ATP-binding protein [Acidimicrobiales bacterium]|nr:ABC transporter ATP-binding protein [Acidimicrobiales bacterium]